MHIHVAQCPVAAWAVVHCNALFSEGNTICCNVTLLSLIQQCCPNLGSLATATCTICTNLCLLSVALYKTAASYTKFGQQLKLIIA